MVGANTAKHFFSNSDQDQLVMAHILNLTHKMGHVNTKDNKYLVITQVKNSSST
jgi:hypothetical protein